MMTEDKLPHILIVDDEPSILKLVSRTMEKNGYPTRTAADGREALLLMKKNHFAVVISDVHMPIMDGYELTKAILSRYPTDVIIMTGKIGQHKYEQFISLGASDFVEKPFTPGEMLLRVKRVIQERSLREDLIDRQSRMANCQKMESIGQIAAGVVHEIKTPLQYIFDNLSFIKEVASVFNSGIDQMESICRASENGELTSKLIKNFKSQFLAADIEFMKEELPKSIDQTSEGIEQINELINAMKSFSHPGQKQHVKSSINKCVKDAIIISKNEWKYIATIKPMLDNTIPLVVCNPVEITQVFLNLMVNACHAIIDNPNPDGAPTGEIRIETGFDKNKVQISISDTGIGIPKGQIKEIFKPFFTTKAVEKGTGQGLAISKSIVEQRHKGQIKVSSVPNQGTRFIIYLPAEKEE